MSTEEREEAIKAIEQRMAELHIGQCTQQERVYTPEECLNYALRMDIPYPGVYVSAEGELLVPPSLFFLRPAATFGIMDRSAPTFAYAGIYTEAHREYLKPARVGHKIFFEGEISDIYERRGFYYIEVKWGASEEDGTVLARGKEGHTIGYIRKKVAE